MNIFANIFDWFLNDFFYRSLNTSISASFLVLAIVLLPLFVQKSTKGAVCCALGLGGNKAGLSVFA